MISEDVLNSALRDLFDVSPVPFSISTTDFNSRYIKVNPAYLRLVGRSWDELAEKPLAIDLPYPIDHPARLERMHLLETQGFYDLTEVEMLRSDGQIFPTLITAQRRRISGESLDIEIVIDNSERKALENAILHAARTDAMTGLHNRASFEAHLVEALAATSDERRLSLAYIDLNRFKQVNDRFGHSVGDSVLKEVARRILEWSADGDFVARLGGDEFAVVSSFSAGRPITLARYLGLAARIADMIQIDSQPVQVGAAIGIAQAAHDMGFSALLDNADRAMYEAKATGNLIEVRTDRPVHAREMNLSYG